MADQIMTVVQGTKAGILSVADHASTLAGNAAGGDYFYFPNDGRTVLVVDGVTGDTFTFTAVADKYGRTETLAPVVASGKFAIIGPFLPELWNDANGRVEFKPTVGNAGDLLLAVRV
jgi:hypothetical protein